MKNSTRNLIFLQTGLISYIPLLLYKLAGQRDQESSFFRRPSSHPHPLESQFNLAKKCAIKNGHSTFFDELSASNWNILLPSGRHA